jgi:hypothetical protein
MLADKFVLRTDREGRLVGLPTFPANEEVEVLVLRQEKPLPAPGQLELEQAYRDASAEIDEAWDVTVGDGLNDEAW